MLEAVFLGLRGVILPHPAFEKAQIETAAAVFGAHGVPRSAFQEAARRRLAEKGPRAWLTLSLADLGIGLAPAVIRSAWIEARRAVPTIQGPSRYRAALRDLALRFQVGFVDAGHPDVLDAVLSHLQLDDLPCRRLWTEKLGDLARPPQGLAFRWLAQRLGLRPSACLYVAGCHPAWSGAREAGWTVWPWSAAPGDPDVDPWELVDGIDRLEGVD